MSFLNLLLMASFCIPLDFVFWFYFYFYFTERLLGSLSYKSLNWTYVDGGMKLISI